jgi:hypothetical protein
MMNGPGSRTVAIVKTGDGEELTVSKPTEQARGHRPAMELVAKQAQTATPFRPGGR